MQTDRGILAIWHDIEPDQTDAVLDWYNKEHHFERLAVPGFRMVRRYTAVEGAPELFIHYETDGASVLSSPAYLERLNAPTPWTLQSQPHFRKNSRTVCHRSLAWGSAEGGFVGVLRILAGDTPQPESLDEQAVQGALADAPGVVGGEIWRSDRERSSIETREKQIRKGQDTYVDAVVVVHATDARAAGNAVERLRGALPSDLTARALTGIWQLSFRAEASGGAR
ncbi:hypothetical protein [Ponticoccus alexandrii]|uniref:Uncharacterized protein n=1 Tax=Ponticoccus alexandrii TaxID=1943633 RepID=A0ABX7FDX2_9RHOB|nr:hypothetical protein [Ponticoccus alexandrii]ETA53253.1 hypothetical protein P279_04295 [Rhodobacteraceae bacterium PD-2]QRF68704.1 hypothetical protein GQA70_20175 [Ponticoccus alexandrii]